MKITNSNKKMEANKMDLHNAPRFLNQFYRFFKQLILILKEIY